MRSRRFVFTYNNYPEEYNDDARLDSWLESIGAKYIIVGREVAPSTNTPHLQGYCEFANARTFARLHQLFPGAHVESARGSGVQCREYCIKDGDFRERGEPPRDPGAREKKRWKEALQMAKEGKFDDIPADIYVRYIGNLQRIHRESLPPIDSLPHTTGLWVMGPTGVGKSRSVREEFPGLYPKPLNKWWDGYKGNKQVLIDDVDPSHGSWIGSFLKIWADHYPFIAEKKGGSELIRPERIICTSQYRLDQIFTDSEVLKALERRFEIKQM